MLIGLLMAIYQKDVTRDVRELVEAAEILGYCSEKGMFLDSELSDLRANVTKLVLNESEKFARMTRYVTCEHKYNMFMVKFITIIDKKEHQVTFNNRESANVAKRLIWGID